VSDGAQWRSVDCIFQVFPDRISSNPDCQRRGRRPYHRTKAVGIDRKHIMEELNGRMLANQILLTGLIARVANEQRDPLRFLTDFRDEIKAVVKGVNIAGMENTDRVRQVAQQTVDELFSLMKPPSAD
jgi:hypothetical protein